MATLGTNNITYRDILSGLKADGSRDADIVELMLQENPILDDIIWKEANEGTMNLTTTRTGLPTVAWTQLYSGPQASKGAKQQVKDASGTAESLIEVDKKLYEIAPDKEQFLLDEAQSHAEAMGNEVASTIIYGNIATDPKTFNGLSIRYPQYGSNDKDSSAYYVLNGAKSNPSTTAYRSIWLVGHGSKSFHGFYPKGTVAGLKRGAVVEEGQMTDNGYIKYIRQQFAWNCGISVKDFRYVGRIANIESDYMLATSGQPDYLELLRRLMIRVRSNGVKQCFYMDRLTFEMLNVVAGRATQSNAIQTTQLFDRRVDTILGIPVRVIDGMSVNETAATSV